ncbi:4Fe-4S dicluster domain-containing protein [Bengtsoniella intestinalis]|uniref:DUF362 domain-containing protein n=1 Tax=Bengtsoniella intestinalis TaxID=3073143 RepID=UPI00391F977A
MAKRMAVVGKRCVACGTCIKVCPFGAITIPTGVGARVNLDKCVGCGKCSKACPASIIAIAQREVAYAG